MNQYHIIFSYTNNTLNLLNLCFSSWMQWTNDVSFEMISPKKCNINSLMPPLIPRKIYSCFQIMILLIIYTIYCLCPIWFYNTLSLLHALIISETDKSKKRIIIITLNSFIICLPLSVSLNFIACHKVDAQRLNIYSFLMNKWMHDHFFVQHS